jgi:hypothetical protein
MDVDNLHITISLSINCRIILCENIWTKQGLVNGSLSTVRDIVWALKKNAKRDPSLALLVHFNNYNGPYLAVTDDGLLLMLIFRSRKEFYRGVIIYSRTQFPIIIIYAITVYKAQKITF